MRHFSKFFAVPAFVLRQFETRALIQFLVL